MDVDAVERGKEKVEREGEEEVAIVEVGLKR